MKSLIIYTFRHAGIGLLFFPFAPGSAQETPQGFPDRRVSSRLSLEVAVPRTSQKEVTNSIIVSAKFIQPSQIFTLNKLFIMTGDGKSVVDQARLT